MQMVAFLPITPTPAHDNNQLDTLQQSSSSTDDIDNKNRQICEKITKLPNKSLSEKISFDSTISNLIR